MNTDFCQEGIIKNISDNTIYVSVIQSSACAGCHAKSACGMSDSKEQIIRISDNGQFQEGEKVKVSFRPSVGMKAVLYAFAIPLILLVVSLALSVYWFEKEALAALAGLSVLAVYYMVLYFLKDKLDKQFTFNIEKQV